jgi:septal ring factor EnvC (AmiA/AmiB activator)
MGMKLAGAMALGMLILCGAFYWYYNDTQERIAILNENNAKLETAVAISEETVSTLQADFATMQQENRRLNVEFAAIDARNKALENRLSRHDIGAAALARTTATEKVLNNASKNVLRCLEIMSGAPLLESELAATKPSEINPECWRDANPNFNPDLQSEAWKRKNL